MGRQCLSLSEQDQSLERSGEEIFTHKKQVFLVSKLPPQISYKTIGFCMKKKVYYLICFSVLKHQTWRKKKFNHNFSE